jgi:hypothetical protein
MRFSPPHPESLTQNAACFQAFPDDLKDNLFSVMAGLVPAIHVFLA